MTKQLSRAERLLRGAALRRSVFLSHHQPPLSSHHFSSSSSSAAAASIAARFTVEGGIQRPTWTSRKGLKTARTVRELRPPGIRGVHPVAVTTFLDDESLDVTSFRRLIRCTAEAGCQGVTILGVLGESNRLVDAEREELIVAAVDEARWIRRSAAPGGSASTFQVCVGTSHPGTEATVQLCQMAQNLGADSVMVAPMVPSPPNEETILHLYRRIHEACPDLPIVVQDHPSSTGVHMSIHLLNSIVQSVPTVACIKLESLPTVDRVIELRRLFSLSSSTATVGLSECSILTGLGALYSGFDVSTGETDGFMTGFAFPEVLKAMHELMPLAIAGTFVDDNTSVNVSGAVERVMAVYRHYLPLLVLEQQPGIGLTLRKEILRRRTWISTTSVRQPGPGTLSPAMHQVLDAQLDRTFRHVDITQPIPPDVVLELAGVRT